VSKRRKVVAAVTAAIILTVSVGVAVALVMTRPAPAPLVALGYDIETGACWEGAEREGQIRRYSLDWNYAFGPARNYVGIGSTKYKTWSSIGGSEMSFVVTAPEYVSAAASDVASIGSAISEANAAAAVPTAGVLPAAADEVSAAIAAVFSTHGQQFQALSAAAASFHQQFVNLMNGGAAQYLSSEAASVSPLQTVQQDVLGVVNAPTLALIGRPLIGNGANGTAANPNGQAGGLLMGSGGTGFSPTSGVGGNGGNAGLLGVGGMGGSQYKRQRFCRRERR
jgi:hypothetical protein